MDADKYRFTSGFLGTSVTRVLFICSILLFNYLLSLLSHIMLLPRKLNH